MSQRRAQIAPLAVARAQRSGKRRDKPAQW
jgi:hypothetical protein